MVMSCCRTKLIYCFISDPTFYKKDQNNFSQLHSIKEASARNPRHYFSCSTNVDSAINFDIFCNNFLTNCLF